VDEIAYLFTPSELEVVATVEAGAPV